MTRTHLIVLMSLITLPFAVGSSFGQSVETRFVQVHAADTIRESRSLLQTMVTTMDDGAEKQRAYEVIAELSELSGDFVDAQRHYRLGHDTLPDNHGLSLLLRSAHLLHELGDSAAARKEAEHVIERSPARRVHAQLLLARVDLASGDSASARSTVAAVPVDRTTEPSVLFVLYDLARQLELDQTANRAQAQLAEFWPNSVEYSLVRTDQIPSDRRVERMPTPSNLLVSVPYLPLPSIEPLNQPSTPVTTDTPGAGESPGSAATVASGGERSVAGIQAGSFRDPENAAFMARDISNAGFPAEVRERGTDGSVNYLVIVPMSAGTTRDAALRTQISLKEAGIEGFLLYD